MSYACGLCTYILHPSYSEPHRCHPLWYAKYLAPEDSMFCFTFTFLIHVHDYLASSLKFWLFMRHIQDSCSLAGRSYLKIYIIILIQIQFPKLPALMTACERGTQQRRRDGGIASRKGWGLERMEEVNLRKKKKKNKTTTMTRKRGAR